MEITKLVDQVGPEWAELLKGFMVAETPGEPAPYDAIASFLTEQKASNISFLPAGGRIYKAFRSTPFQNTRVIILGQDPYFKAGYPTGVAFAVEPPSKKPKALDKLFKGIEADVYHGLKLDIELQDMTLNEWTDQGVLMLNTALTVQQDVANSHQKIWRPFIEYFIKAVQTVKKDMIWIGLGAEAREVLKEVNVFRNFVYTAEHPAAAARDGNRDWNHNNVFSRTNLAIIGNGLGNEIKWFKTIE